MNAKAGQNEGFILVIYVFRQSTTNNIIIYNTELHSKVN